MNTEPLEICLDKVAGNEFFDENRVGRFSRISFHRTLRIHNADSAVRGFDLNDHDTFLHERL